MPVFNKLIRDKIPDIISAKGETAVTHIATDDEYRAQLDQKLREEVEEFLVAHDPEELADVLEVLLAQAELVGGMAAVETKRQQKADERGAFTRRLILDETR